LCHSEQDDFVVLHHDQCDLRSEGGVGGCLDQLQVYGSERSVGLDFNLIAGLDHVGVMLTLIKGRFDDGAVNPEGVRKGVMLDAEHLKQDPHRPSFCGFCSAAFESTSGRIPSFADHAKAVAGLHELR
jgi:hypothetical protein